MRHHRCGDLFSCIPGININAGKIVETYKQDPNQYPPQPPFGYQQALPNATAILVLGIISLVLCGVVGLVCGIIALSKAGKAKALNEANPGKYTESSFSNMQSGRTCALIGVILSAVVFVFMIFYFIFIFTFATSLGNGLHY